MQHVFLGLEVKSLGPSEVEQGAVTPDTTALAALNIHRLL